jgi:hypothetical protein
MVILNLKCKCRKLLEETIRKVMCHWNWPKSLDMIQRVQSMKEKDDKFNFIKICFEKYSVRVMARDTKEWEKIFVKTNS